jgi:hypothetical protein
VTNPIPSNLLFDDEVSLADPNPIFDVGQYHRPNFADTTIQSDVFDTGSWVVELKQDGRWGLVMIVKGVATIYSRANGVDASIDLGLPFLNCVLVGEHMYSSNWAYRHGVNGKFYAFDILGYHDKDFRDFPWFYRRYVLVEVMERISQVSDVFILNPVWQADKRNTLWSEYVEAQDYEGLVMKDVTASYNEALWYRAKQHFTMDYVCMGFTEGGGRNQGRVGAVYGGLYKNGVLVNVCSVGGGLSDAQRIEYWENRDKYVGRVFEARGWKVFAGGALRHPNFTAWRDVGDKQPEECIWNTGGFVDTSKVWIVGMCK